jgi:hypothetical protein
MEKEHGPLCQSCEASGAGQRVIAELMGEQREQEARFAAAASQVGVFALLPNFARCSFFFELEPPRGLAVPDG